jgi:neutral amino acid transport system permease protein
MDFGTILGNALRAAFGADAAIYALAAIGLNLHYGFTGLLNFGQVGFMLLGAYGVAISVATWGLPLWAGILMGLSWGVLLALFLGFTTLRLRADYFAITTIATAEILRVVIRSKPAEDITGGVYGLQDLSGSFYDLNPLSGNRIGIGTFSYTSNQLYAALVVWTLVAICTVILILLVRSPWGRVIKSIREDEDAARSLGKNVFAYKLQSLVVGGLFAGIGGVMFAIVPSAVNADSFLPTVTFFAYTILILGGAASRFGPIVGSIIFWFIVAGVESFMREAQAEDLLPGVLGNSGAVGAVSNALVGLALILLLVFRPQGILGNRTEMQINA